MIQKDTNPVRIGLVGCGGIATVHAAALARIPNAQLVAVYADNPEYAQKFVASDDAVAAAGGQAIAVCASLEEFLSEKSGVDAVLIASPSGVHMEGALPALQAGKHVLCEKPLEINSERIKAMTEAANASGAIFGGLLPLRCGAGALAIWQAVQQGRFGKLTFLSARIKWWRAPEYYTGSPWRGTWALDGGGALMNQGIHAVDLLLWLGGKVSEVSAFASKLVHESIEVEDTLSATLRFENGALGTIAAATTCYPGIDFTLEISGDKGTAILVNDKISFWRFEQEQPEDEAVRSGNLGGKIHGGSSDPKAISSEGHREQIADFCTAIQSGERKAIIDSADAGAAVPVIEAAYRSAKSGKVEAVKQLF